MKYRVLITLFAIALFSGNAFGASKKAEIWKRSTVVKAFKSYMKDKKYAMAKSEIDGAFSKFAEAKEDAELYSLKANALNELIVAENRKIYLNQKPDTVKYFSLIFELYENGLAGDSIEQHSIRVKAEKGKKAKVKYRYNLGSKMLSYRKNLLQAGKYFYRKRNYTNAFLYFDMYIGTCEAEVFLDNKGTQLCKDEEDIVDVSTLALLSAYASNNHEGVLKFLSESAKDESLREQMLEIGYKSASELKDTLSMVRLLETGFAGYPENNNFFVSIIKYYNSIERYDLALAKAVKKVEAHPDGRDWWFVKGKEEMLLGKFTDAIASFEKCVSIKADDSEAYSSLGNIHLYYAHEKYSNFSLSVNDPNYASVKSEINEEYKKACTCFELAKKFDENNTAIWLEGLRECYFKLNRGKDLKNLDSVVK